MNAVSGDCPCSEVCFEVCFTENTGINLFHYQMFRTQGGAFLLALADADWFNVSNDLPSFGTMTHWSIHQTST